MTRWLSIDSVDGELVITWRAERWQWRDILDAFKREFSRDAEFDQDSKTWRLPHSYYRAVRMWAGRYFERDEIRDRTAPKNEQQRRSSAPVEEAYRVLWLADGAPGWAIEAMYRACSKAYHPDIGAGGSHDSMKRVNCAVELLRQVAS